MVFKIARHLEKYTTIREIKAKYSQEILADLLANTPSSGGEI